MKNIRKKTIKSNINAKQKTCLDKSCLQQATKELSETAIAFLFWVMRQESKSV
jgi:hypothetical protein